MQRKLQQNWERFFEEERTKEDLRDESLPFEEVLLVNRAGNDTFRRVQGQLYKIVIVQALLLRKELPRVTSLTEKIRKVLILTFILRHQSSECRSSHRLNHADDLIGWLRDVGTDDSSLARSLSRLTPTKSDRGARDHRNDFERQRNSPLPDRAIRFHSTEADSNQLFPSNLNSRWSRTSVASPAVRAPAT